MRGRERGRQSIEEILSLSKPAQTPRPHPSYLIGGILKPSPSLLIARNTKDFHPSIDTKNASVVRSEQGSSPSILRSLIPSTATNANNNKNKVEEFKAAILDFIRSDDKTSAKSSFLQRFDNAGDSASTKKNSAISASIERDVRAVAASFERGGTNETTPQRDKEKQLQHRELHNSNAEEPPKPPNFVTETSPQKEPSFHDEANDMHLTPIKATTTPLPNDMNDLTNPLEGERERSFSLNKSLRELRQSLGLNQRSSFGSTLDRSLNKGDARKNSESPHLRRSIKIERDAAAEARIDLEPPKPYTAVISSASRLRSTVSPGKEHGELTDTLPIDAIESLIEILSEPNEVNIPQDYKRKLLRFAELVNEKFSETNKATDGQT